MTTGLDPKRRKDTSLGSNPPAHGFIDNKFDGTSNPNQGEAYDLDPALAPNKFPREGGSDSAAEFAGGDFAG